MSPPRAKPFRNRGRGRVAHAGVRQLAPVVRPKHAGLNVNPVLRHHPNQAVGPLPRVIRPGEPPGGPDRVIDRRAMGLVHPVLDHGQQQQVVRFFPGAGLLPVAKVVDQRRQEIGSVLLNERLQGSGDAGKVGDEAAGHDHAVLGDPHPIDQRLLDDPIPAVREGGEVDRPDDLLSLGQCRRGDPRASKRPLRLFAWDTPCSRE
jgi:hypothetical protein